jgi:hypothetical protein
MINPLRRSYDMYYLLFNIKRKLYVLPLNFISIFVWFSEQEANIYINTIKLLVFAMENHPTVIKKGKFIHVTGRGGPQDCEMYRLPHFLDNRLTGGG